MEPFEKKKTEEELVGEVLVNKAIKNKLNAPRKEVKFTWEGLKNFVPFLETNPFDPLKVKRIKELTEGAEPKEKDYIEGFEEIERSLYGGVQDLGYSISSLVTEGIDAAFDTDYLQAIDKAYEENKIKYPETLVGEFAKVGGQQFREGREKQLALKEKINAVVFGPLAFDNSISKKSAAIKGIKNIVAGQADVLLVPNIESGNGW